MRKLRQGADVVSPLAAQSTKVGCPARPRESYRYGSEKEKPALAVGYRKRMWFLCQNVVR